jgi:flagellar hook-associated protein 3 FlgL
MRVTEKMLFNSTITRTGKARENLQRAQNEVSGGMRVEHPGDDPVAAGLATTHMVDKARFLAVASAAQRAADELNAADTALDSITAVANRVMQVATQFGNDSYTALDRKTAAVEVGGLFKETLSLLNTTYGGRYIFAGFNDKTIPFDATGSYVGDTNVRTVEVAPGLYEDSSLRADVIVKGAGGGVDFLQTMQDLVAAMNSNDGDGIRGQLDKMNSVIEQLAAGRTQAGMSQSFFQSAVATSESATADETMKIGHLIDADVIGAASRLTSAQYALNAALSAASKTFSLTIVDKL